MESTKNKILIYMKNNIGTIVLMALFITILLVPDARAIVQRGMMKTGLFDPKLEKIETDVAKTPDNGDYQMNLVDASGLQSDLHDLKGKVVFINFWATWCPPCIAEMPSLQVLHDKFKDNKEVAFLFIDVDNNPAKSKKFMENKKLTLPIYFVQGNIPAELFQGNLPTTIILDKEGNIAHRTLGMADYSGDDVVNFLKNLQAK